jgi:hypothetical protein
MKSYAHHWQHIDYYFQVSWQDPNQKVRFQSVDASRMPAISVSQPPTSEITVGAVVDTVETPIAMAAWNSNMVRSQLALTILLDNVSTVAG